jgi:hypothetical protein
MASLSWTLILLTRVDEGAMVADVPGWLFVFGRRFVEGK